MKIVIGKTGMTWDPTVNSKPSRGEIGETLGLIKHLLDCGHEVTYHGYVAPSKESLLEALGVEVLRPATAGFDSYTLMDEQLENVEFESERLRERGIECFIDMIGMSGSRMLSEGTIVQSWQAHKAAPVRLGAAAAGLPRVVVTTDARQYPHEIDWVTRYPSLRPIAWLSQRSAQKKYKVGGVPHLRKEVRCDAHSWWVRAFTDRPDAPKPPRTPIARRPISMACVSHAHIDTGYKERRRDDAWRVAFENSISWMIGRGDCAIIGEGWEDFSLRHADSDGRLFTSPVAASGIFELLETVKCGPQVTPMPDNSWPITAKASMHAWAGSVMLPVGECTLPHCYDPRCEIWSEDHWCRLREPRDMRIVVETLDRFPERGDEESARVWEIVKPKWTEIDACLDAVSDRFYETDPVEMFERFGGAVPL